MCTYFIASHLATFTQNQQQIEAQVPKSALKKKEYLNLVLDKDAPIEKDFFSSEITRA